MVLESVLHVAHRLLLTTAQAMWLFGRSLEHASCAGMALELDVPWILPLPLP
jgi:hypothetical protein